jgi:tetratricopeptide (TPR) repeat protein
MLHARALVIRGSHYVLFVAAALELSTAGLASASQDSAATSSLIEFTEDEVRTLLGSPSSASRSGGATFWSYDGTTVGSVSVEFVAGKVVRMIPDGMIQELQRRAGEKRRITAANLTQPEPTDPRELLAFHMQRGRLAFQEGRWLNAETSLRAALKAAEYFGLQNPFVAVALYFLGSTQQKQDRPADAEPLFQRALAILDVQPTIEDLELAAIHGLILNDLAIIYASGGSTATRPSANQDRLHEAERLFQRALAIREKSDRSQVGRTLGNLTQVYIDLGRWNEAAVWAQRAVSFFEQAGPESSGTAILELDRLAEIYLHEGRLAEAEPLIRRIVSYYEQNVGPNWLGIATRLESYAVALRKADRGADARKAETQARKIRSSSGPTGR